LGETDEFLHLVPEQKIQISF